MLSAHPWNVCLYQEAQGFTEGCQYNNTDLERQVAAYRSEGSPTPVSIGMVSLSTIERAIKR